MTAAHRLAGAAAVAVLGALLLCLPVRAAGQERLRMTTARQASGEDVLHMQVVYGAGRLDVGAAPEGLLYRAEMQYDAGSFRPVREYRRTDGGARVRLGVESEGGGRDLDMDWESLDLSPLSLGNLDVGDSEPGEMHVGLPRSVPTDLDVRVGAAESTMELGGLPLRSLRIATGASETEVTFERPNPVSMERLEVKAGAASLEIRGLGNARARRIDVKNGVGEVTLDFSGRWTGNTTASVKTGLGTVTLRVPPDVGVKVRKNTVLSSFTGLGLEKADDGSYRTENWGGAAHRLVLQVDAAFGSIEIERTR